MTTLPHPFGTVYQIAFVVDDLEKAAAVWQQAGAGPFYHFPQFEFSNVTVPKDGRSPRMSILLGYSGTTMIELMKIEDDPHGHFAHLSPGAVHHLAVLTPNIDQYLAAPDMLKGPLLFQGAFPTGTPLAFLDTRAQTGLITELITADDMVAAMITEMYGQAKTFNGDNLIRSFG